MAEEVDYSQWLHACFRMGMTAAAHPMEYVKILIQIGYEPFPPRPTKTFFGKPALSLPGMFEYMGYIRRQDGLLCLYTGVLPRVCATIVSGYVFGKVTENIEIRRESAEEEEHTSPDDKISEFLLVTSRDMVARCLAIVASQPFQVVTVRMIAQFVGKETQYSGIFASFKSIIVNEGISGFFVGLVPRIMAEVLSLWISNSLTFVINTYIVEDHDFKCYTSAAMAFIASALTYPFSLISNIMAVNDSGLAAGMPPMMPVYSNWTDCWSHLNHQNQLKRGSSIMWRYYTGPHYGSSTSAPNLSPLIKKPSYSSSQSHTGLLNDFSLKAPLDKPFTMFQSSGDHASEFKQ